ncbi:MAG: protein translocase subunit SecD [Patescibacteria group bacterium]
MRLGRLLTILILTLISAYIALPTKLPYGLTRPPIAFWVGDKFFFKSFDTKLGLDLAGGSSMVFEADTSKVSQEDKEDAIIAAKDAIERRINLFGVAESTVQTSRVGGFSRIIVELPAVTDTRSAVALIGQTAQLDFREYVPEKEASPSGQITYENTVSTGFTGNDFKKARADFDPQTGKPMISFETKEESAKKFTEITTRLQGKPLAIFLDKARISAPTVQTPITTGLGIIQGEFTLEGAKSLANLLNSGALPIPIQLIEQRTVGATLGAESIKASITAGLVGLGAVVLFMVLYYGRLGIASCFALLIYGLLSLAVYKLIPVVLTLPGIAGFILSIGMAVDSNILIFERLKEEIRNGRMFKDALEVAFGRAWDSIRDANIATLVTSFILFNPLNFEVLHTSGPIRGFAATLFLGVVISLFTGIFVTRTLLRVFARK